MDHLPPQTIPADPEHDLNLELKTGELRMLDFQIQYKKLELGSLERNCKLAISRFEYIDKSRSFAETALEIFERRVEVAQGELREMKEERREEERILGEVRDEVEELGVVRERVRREIGRGEEGLGRWSGEVERVANVKIVVESGSENVTPHYTGVEKDVKDEALLSYDTATRMFLATYGVTVIFGAVVEPQSAFWIQILFCAVALGLLLCAVDSGEEEGGESDGKLEWEDEESGEEFDQESDANTDSDDTSDSKPSWTSEEPSTKPEDAAIENLEARQETAAMLSSYNCSTKPKDQYHSSGIATITPNNDLPGAWTSDDETETYPLLELSRILLVFLLLPWTSTIAAGGLIVFSSLWSLSTIEAWADRMDCGSEAVWLDGISSGDSEWEDLGGEEEMENQEVDEEDLVMV